MIFELYCLITGGELESLHLGSSIATGRLNVNSPLWFLFSLFFCNIIYYTTSKVGGGRFNDLTALLCVILAYITHNKPQIFGYGNIFLGLSFIHLGYLLRQYKDSLNKWYYGIPVLMIILGIALFAPQRLEFVRNMLVQGNWILNYVYTVLACFLMWYISQLWKHDNLIGNGIVYLGRDSLVLFAFHRPVLNWVVEPILRYLNPSITYYEFLTLSLASLILLYILLNYILREHFPCLLGLETRKVAENY